MQELNKVCHRNRMRVDILLTSGKQMQFTYRRDGLIKQLMSAISFIEGRIPSRERERYVCVLGDMDLVFAFYNFTIGVWNCSDGVVFLHFISILKYLAARSTYQFDNHIIYMNKSLTELTTVVILQPLRIRLFKY